jgi:glycosyltransferase involved in cell wall biosynthesis
MPRVLQVAEATIGGVRRHLRELSLGLAEAGWHVDVACARRRDPGFARDLDQFHARGLGVHEVPMLRRPAPWGDFAAMRRLQAVIREARPDVIHAHSSKAGLIARLAARRSGIPVCYTPHGFAFDMQVHAAPRRVYREVERRLAPLTACLIAVSRAEQAAALALDYPPGRVRLIPNGIPVGTDAAPTAPDRIYDVAFIGRFCRQKGVDLMIEAMARLKAQRPELRLTVMGGGSRRIERRLSGLCASAAFSFGEGESVQKLLSQSRILAMPSRWEGLPYLLLEAMAAGTAVAVAGVGGVTDVVTDGREALVFPPGSVPELERALIRLLDDDGLQQRLTEAARLRVQDLSLETMVDAIRRCYEEYST